MGLVPRLKVIETETSFLVTDITGLFSSDNLGGFGVQTIRPEWITSATLVIEHPRTGTISPPIDVNGRMVNDRTKDHVAQIMPWDISVAWQTLPVGKYKFTYTIKASHNGNNFIATGSIYCVAIKLAECCLDKLTGKVRNVPFNSLFKDELSRKHAELSIILRRVKDALRPECIDIAAADNMVWCVFINCNCNC